MIKALIVFSALFLFSSCNSIESVIVRETPRDLAVVKLEFDDVIRTLDGKPSWLFPANMCPAELVSDNEVEVKYLSEGCESKPKQCLEKCRENDGNACYSLALHIQKALNLEKVDDPGNQLSEALFLRSCKLGVTSGCTNRAAGMLQILSAEADSDPIKLKCVADTFEKTCAKEDRWGCTMYGLVLLDGTGRTPNTEEAKKYFDKACEGISGEASEACRRGREFASPPDDDSKFK